MTDLTEQWKKGKLPFGYYYVKFLNGKEGIKKLGEFAYRKLIGEVIDIVPSYEEWKASENYIDYLKQCISVYESKDKQATETSIAYNELLEENTKLKKLLKECKEVIKNVDTYYGNYDSTNGFLIVEKINQVLGEDK